MQKIFIYDKTAIGEILIGEKEEKINYLLFSDEKTFKNKYGDPYIIEETINIKKIKKQLDEYFLGNRKEFDISLAGDGTSFQKRVWEELKKIPYGETRTYKQIAEAIGNEKASRAVGLANNKNPISIIIPCHRVIGTNGKMIGYGGGILKKEELLKIEGIINRI